MSARDNTPRKFISKFGRAGNNIARQPKAEENVEQPKTETNEIKERLRWVLPYMQMAVEIGVAFWNHFGGGGDGGAAGGGAST